VRVFEHAVALGDHGAVGARSARQNDQIGVRLTGALDELGGVIAAQGVDRDVAAQLPRLFRDPRGAARVDAFSLGTWASDNSTCGSSMVGRADKSLDGAGAVVHQKTRSTPTPAAPQLGDRPRLPLA